MTVPRSAGQHLSALAETRGTSPATLRFYLQDIERLVRACLDQFQMVGRDVDSLTLVDLAQQTMLREQYVRPRTTSRDRSALAWFSRAAQDPDHLEALFQQHGATTPQGAGGTPQLAAARPALRSLIQRLEVDRPQADQVLGESARRRRALGLNLLLDAVSATLRLDPSAVDSDRDELAKRLAGVATQQGRSAPGAKEISADLFHRLLRALQQAAAKRRETGTAARQNTPALARTFAHATYLTGLRPVEWPTAQLLVQVDGKTLPISQAPGWGDQDKVRALLSPEHRPQLYCENAKESAVTACGPWRRLHLAAMAAGDVAVVLAATIVARQVAKDWRRLTGNISLAIRRAGEDLAPRHPPISLYTFRHDFARRARAAGYTGAQIAALMGHISPLTNEHYGKSRGKRATGGGATATITAAPREAGALPGPDPVNLEIVQAWEARQAPEDTPALGIAGARTR